MTPIAAALGACPVSGPAAETQRSGNFGAIRPHSAIGNLPPTIYAKLSDPTMQRDGSLRIGGYAPPPVASPSQQGSNEGQALTSNWMKDGVQVNIYD
jgi:hypothetical protein